MLDTNIKEFIELGKQEDALKARKEELKAKIIEELAGRDKYQNDFAKVVVSLSETFKYENEVGMINLMRESGYGSYVKEKIDTTAFNKLLKANEKLPLYESMRNQKMISKSFIEKLTIKEI